jgi:hypothetical protein
VFKSAAKVTKNNKTHKKKQKKVFQVFVLIFNPSSFILHPSSFILHPSPFTLQVLVKIEKMFFSEAVFLLTLYVMAL